MVKRQASSQIGCGIQMENKRAQNRGKILLHCRSGKPYMSYKIHPEYNTNDKWSYCFSIRCCMYNQVGIKNVASHKDVECGGFSTNRAGCGPIVVEFHRDANQKIVRSHNTTHRQHILWGIVFVLKQLIMSESKRGDAMRCKD